MIARDRPPRSRKSPAAAAPTFELERYAWAAPDRLELAGTFTGLAAPPADAPVLVLSGAERTHRLPAAGEVSGAPKNGKSWRAAFVWQEAPAAFQSSILELGPRLAVDLPEPGADGVAAGPVELAARETPAAPAPDTGGPGVDRLRLAAEQLAAAEELQEATAALRRSEEELSRARADLEAERDGRAADAARFREGLAQMRASAEEALAAEQSASRRLRDDLEAAIEAADAKEAELRMEFDTAAAVWEDAQATSQAELAELQLRLDALSTAAGDTDRVRAELVAARAEADEAQRRIDAARHALEDAPIVSETPAGEGS